MEARRRGAVATGGRDVSGVVIDGGRPAAGDQAAQSVAGPSRDAATVLVPAVATSSLRPAGGSESMTGRVVVRSTLGLACLAVVLYVSVPTFVWRIVGDVAESTYAHIPEPGETESAVLSSALAYSPSDPAGTLGLCDSPARLGNPLDGGYVVCLQTIRQPGCVAYSFGVNTDPSFDRASRQLGCEVHSFDPTVSDSTYQFEEGHSFHKVGLGANAKGGQTSYTNDMGWTMWTLKETMAQLGHTKIDILKIDIEGYEWEVLEQMFDDNVLAEDVAVVGQLILEVHFEHRDDSTANLEHLQLMDRLHDEAGFQLLFKEPNLLERLYRMRDGAHGRSCMNLSWMNKNWHN